MPLLALADWDWDGVACCRQASTCDRSDATFSRRSVTAATTSTTGTATASAAGGDADAVSATASAGATLRTAVEPAGACRDELDSPALGDGCAGARSGAGTAVADASGAAAHHPSALDSVAVAAATGAAAAVVRVAAALAASAVALARAAATAASPAVFSCSSAAASSCRNAASADV